MSLKDKLRALLVEKGIKPADLARDAGVSEAMISYYLSGQREPMGKTCFKLAAALGVSVDELLESPFAEEAKKMRLETEKPATDDGDWLTEAKKELIEYIKGLPDERVASVHRFLQEMIGEDKK